MSPANPHAHSALRDRTNGLVQHAARGQQGDCGLFWESLRGEASLGSRVTEIDTRVTVGTVSLHACTFEQATLTLLRSRDHAVGGVRLVNAWCVVVAQDDLQYRAIVNGPGLTLPDGAPVLRAMRRNRSAAEAERVRGPSLFEATLDRGRGVGLRHFLLGGEPATLELLATAIDAKYPGAEIAGAWSPPFGEVDDALINESVSRILDSGAEIVWVGMGAPKQDTVGAAIVGHTGLTAVGVGAAFDFLAGTVLEAPTWAQEAGLEWLFRLLREPRRLWRRYLVGNVRFLWIVFRQ